MATYYDDSVYLYFTAALMRLDAGGQVLTESKMLYGLSSVYAGWANCATRVRDGGIAIGGNTYPPSHIAKAAIIRYAANGDSLWLREYGDVLQESAGRQVKQTKDGGYILCGEINIGGANDALLIKTDSLGNEEWHRSYGVPQLADGAVSVDTTMDDGYYVGGQYRVSQNDKNFWVFRVDANGDSLWSKQWGTPFNEPNAHLTTLANGNPIIASASDYSQDNSVGRFYMAELDQYDGHFVWQRYYGPTTSDGLFAVKEVRPGEGCIASGLYFEPDSSAYFKGSLLRTAANGDSLWMRNYVYYDSLMNDGRGYFRDVLPTADGGFIACGATNGCYSGNCPPQYEQDAWVVKVDSLGCIVPGCNDFGTSITEQITNLGYALSVYPNPVRDELHVGINLPANFKTEGSLVLSVTSLEGKLVKQQQVPTSLVHFPLSLGEGQGEGALNIDVADLTPGTYSLHLSDSRTWIAGKKFVVE